MKGDQEEVYKPTFNNYDGDLLTVNQMSQVSNLGLSAVRRVASESGSIRRIGRSYRINKKIFLDYIEKVYSS